VKRTTSDDEFIDDFENERKKARNDDADFDPNGQSSSGGSGDSTQSQGSQSTSDGSQTTSDGSQITSDEEAPDPNLILAGQRIQIANVNSIAQIQYIVDPAYTPSARLGAGGESAVATLGPGAYRSMNSDADRTAIPAIVQAEQAYLGHTFKAGHLLNAEFGGPGNNAANLTILTTTANAGMRAFDNAIKDAITLHLTAAYTAMNNMGLDVTDFDYGVEVTITTDSTFWSNVATDAGYLICDGVTGLAVIENEPTAADLETALTVRWGTDRVGNHAQLLAQFTTAVGNLQNKVTAANAIGHVPNP
jgi:hypothetical protein